MADKKEETPRGPRFSVNLAVTCYPPAGATGFELPSSGLRFDRFTGRMDSSDQKPDESVDPKSEKEVQAAGREGMVMNVSSGGACIVTDFPLPLSDVLKVAFPIQSHISDFISTPRTLAEVRWTFVFPDHRYVSGLRFLF
jgi:hypothetical protein